MTDRLFVHIFVQDGPTGLSDAMPKIFAALRMQLPEGWQAAKYVQAEPIAELLLDLTDPQIKAKNGVRAPAPPPFFGAG